MKHIIFTILTILLFCGSVYGNPAIEALEDEIKRLEQLHDINDFERHWKLKEILESLKTQERDREIIKEWEDFMKESPCDTIFHDGFACEKVRV